MKKRLDIFIKGFKKMKLITFLFIFILSSCGSIPLGIYVINETKDEVGIKFIFNKKYAGESNVLNLLPFEYSSDRAYDYNKRIKVKENTKSIIMDPYEKIELGCGAHYRPYASCIYEEFKITKIEFIEITHLRLKKKIIFTSDTFYDLRHFFIVDTIYIKDSMFR
jgi:hypothetical protein